MPRQQLSEMPAKWRELQRRWERLWNLLKKIRHLGCIIETVMRICRKLQYSTFWFKNKQTSRTNKQQIISSPVKTKVSGKYAPREMPLLNVSHRQFSTTSLIPIARTSLLMISNPVPTNLRPLVQKIFEKPKHKNAWQCADDKLASAIGLLALSRVKVICWITTMRLMSPMHVNGMLSLEETANFEWSLVYLNCFASPTWKQQHFDEKTNDIPVGIMSTGCNKKCCLKKNKNTSKCQLRRWHSALQSHLRQLTEVDPCHLRSLSCWIF